LAVGIWRVAPGEADTALRPALLVLMAGSAVIMMMLDTTLN
jgi:hypothetical protein